MLQHSCTGTESTLVDLSFPYQKESTVIISIPKRKYSNYFNTKKKVTKELRHLHLFPLFYQRFFQEGIVYQ